MDAAAPDVGEDRCASITPRRRRRGWITCTRSSTRRIGSSGSSARIDAAVQTAPAHDARGDRGAAGVARRRAGVGGDDRRGSRRAVALCQARASSWGTAGRSPSEASSGAIGRGGAGSRRPATRICGASSIEAAWAYRHRAHASAPRCGNVRRRSSPAVKAIAWKAQHRLARAVSPLTGRGKCSQQVVTAIGRELLGFIWAIGVPCRSRPAAATAQSRERHATSDSTRSSGGGRGAHGTENPRDSLCGGPSGSTRAASPRQLPTDHDYAVSTREYQSDQPSRTVASTAFDAVISETIQRDNLTGSFQIGLDACCTSDRMRERRSAGQRDQTGWPAFAWRTTRFRPRSSPAAHPDGTTQLEAATPCAPADDVAVVDGTPDQRAGAGADDGAEHLRLPGSDDRAEHAARDGRRRSARSCHRRDCSSNDCRSRDRRDRSGSYAAHDSGDRPAGSSAPRPSSHAALRSGPRRSSRLARAPRSRRSCSRSHRRSARSRRSRPWAINGRRLETGERCQEHCHDCHSDAIHNWPAFTTGQARTPGIVQVMCRAKFRRNRPISRTAVSPRAVSLKSGAGRTL